MPDEPLSNKAKDRHVGESTKKRASLVQKPRENPARDRLVAPRLHDPRHIGWRREGNRRICRHSLRVYDHIIRRPAAPMSAGLAARMPIRRPIRRLESKAPLKPPCRSALLV